MDGGDEPYGESMVVAYANATTVDDRSAAYNVLCTMFELLVHNGSVARAVKIFDACDMDPADVVMSTEEEETLPADLQARIAASR
jgi:hypothetical protein